MSIVRVVLQKQGWHEEMVSMGVDRLTEEVKGVSVLYPAGLPNGKQPCPKNLSLVAAGTIT